MHTHTTHNTRTHLGSADWQERERKAFSGREARNFTLPDLPEGSQKLASRRVAPRLERLTEVGNPGLHVLQDEHQLKNQAQERGKGGMGAGWGAEKKRTVHV